MPETIIAAPTAPEAPTPQTSTESISPLSFADRVTEAAGAVNALSALGGIKKPKVGDNDVFVDGERYRDVDGQTMKVTILPKQRAPKQDAFTGASKTHRLVGGRPNPGTLTSIRHITQTPLE